MQVLSESSLKSCDFLGGWGVGGLTGEMWTQNRYQVTLSISSANNTVVM